MKVAAFRSWFRISRVGVVSLALHSGVGCQAATYPAASPEQTTDDDTTTSTQQNGTSPEGAAGDVDPLASRSGLSTADNPGDGSWWTVPYPSTFDPSALLNTPSRVSVKGNRFVDEDGNTIVFHGVNISDPDKLSRDGHWSKKHFEAVANWGADVVRIPVHPSAWRGRGKEAYFALLDEAVTWANELGLYVIIDWHSIGNLRTGMFQHPMYNTTLQETNEFWRAVSHRYAGVPTVAFYELFNEPTLYNGTLGTMTWNEWKGLVEEMISIIQSHDSKVVPLVGGFNWAYDLRDADKHPVNRQGIAYVSHPYPEKTTAPFDKNWDRDFGNITKHHPLFATEIGYMAPDAPGAHVPVKDDGSYGKRITDYLDKKGASWTAWCFEPDWPPQLIADWNYTPTPAGDHFRSVMLEKAKIRAANQQLVAEAAASKKAAEEQKAAAAKTALDKKAADKQAALDKKAADKQAALDKKAADKQAAEAKKAAAAQAAEQKATAANTAKETAAAPKQVNSEATPVAVKPEPSAPPPPETAAKPANAPTKPVAAPAKSTTPAASVAPTPTTPKATAAPAPKPATAKVVAATPAPAAASAAAPAPVAPAAPTTPNTSGAEKAKPKAPKAAPAKPATSATPPAAAP